ncbi:hypothetical protein KOAAANKH_02557 [Brevundimonas sp. NIBR10]|uniref:hypothetical protein n=1 Tax=Brevundimonas sp. NIBR10 TaxID=3015997 RepID=UPI0022F1AFAA|nr:hypothetical protein [Brevundimonas sp. NIBR10]WGM47675.1 hypothetical protein KOAAANKH_02557 [Brevundimonas sp. NIBR10]
MNQAPRGTVERTYENAAGQTVAVIRWTRGAGPASAVGQFRVGQAVTTRGQEVVGA